jgi:hypothetical protein
MVPNFLFSRSGFFVFVEYFEREFFFCWTVFTLTQDTVQYVE